MCLVNYWALFGICNGRLLLDSSKRPRINAIPFVRRLRLVINHMAEMTAAFRVQDSSSFYHQKEE